MMGWATGDGATMVLWLVCAGALVLAALGTMRRVFRPPSLKGRTASLALPASARTPLGRAVAAAVGQPDQSGATPLFDGSTAFAARMALIGAARESLDIQYYIWQRDATGLVLLEALQQAADRGVRIRLLLDDHGSAALDSDLAALDAHPQIEVRLFNPYILRRMRLIGFLFDFARLNRRMHNKSLTADGAATIVGGRNIGDIYFAYGEGVHYVDTDILAVGQIAADVSDDFDRYWCSLSVHPASRIVQPAPDAWDRLAGEAAAIRTSAAGRAYMAALPHDGPVAALLAGKGDLDIVPVRLVSDHPAKGLGRARRNQLLYHRLIPLIGQPVRSLDVISAYFVPSREITRALAALAGRGRRVRVLTNSQQATDVLVVHSAYVRYRPRLLDAGVELYELKANARIGRPRHRRNLRPHAVVGSSRSSLHSKSLAVDDERVFVGSFNFDHRSLDLNTEMGVLIDSPRIARGIAEGFDGDIRNNSYRPRRDARGRLVWEDPARPGDVHLVEPDTTLPSRVVLAVMGWLPIEWLL